MSRIIVLVSLCGIALQLATVGNCQADESRLYILSLLPYPDENASLAFRPSFDGGPSLFLAAQLAVERINNRSDILEEYTLELIQGDSGCDVQLKTAAAFVEHVLTGEKQIIGMVGPACSTAGLLLGPLTGRDQIALINVHIAASPLLEDRQKYPFSFGTLDSSNTFVDSLIAMMRMNNWGKVAVLYDESRAFYYSTQLAFEQRVSDLSGYAIEYSSAVLTTYIPFDDLRSVGVRIVILLVGPDFLNNILCLAYHDDFLFPAYQFIAISETVLVDELNQIEFRLDRRQVSCSREDVLKAVNGSIIIDFETSPRNKSEKSLRVGLSFEEFDYQYRRSVDRNGLTPNIFAPAYHDAVWSLALALDDSIKALNKLNFSLSQYGFGHSYVTNIIQQQLFELEYVGVSGTVKFDNLTGYSRRTVEIFQVENNSMSLVARYNGSTDNITLTSQAKFINDVFKPVVNNLHAPLSAAGIALLINGVALILLIVSHILMVVYRKERPIKASQPKLNHLAYIGCHLLLLVIASYVAIETFDFATKTKCILYHVLNTSASSAATLLFGVLCTKTWRIYKIFVSWKNPGRLISDKFLISFVLFLLSVDTLVSIIWIAVDPFVPVIIPISRDGDIETIQKTCSANNYSLWFGILLGYNVLIMFGSIYLAFLCHGHIPKVQREFQTNTTIILVYVLSFTCALGFAVFFTLRGSASITLEFIALCLIFTVSLYSCLLFLFLPPVIQVLKFKRRTHLL